MREWFIVVNLYSKYMPTIPKVVFERQLDRSYCRCTGCNFNRRMQNPVAGSKGVDAMNRYRRCAGIGDLDLRFGPRELVTLADADRIHPARGGLSTRNDIQQSGRYESTHAKYLAKKTRPNAGGFLLLRKNYSTENFCSVT